MNRSFIRLKEVVAEIGGVSQIETGRLEALAQAADALRLTTTQYTLSECVKAVVENMLLATVRILHGDGGLLYFREDAAVPMKRVIAAVEDDEIISISKDPRFQHFERPIPIEGAGELVWERLTELDDFWLTEIDDPVLPSKLVDWHKRLGHKWLAHFALRRGSYQHGFFVISYREERAIEPLTAQIGSILALQIALTLELLTLSRSGEEHAVSAARSDFYREVHDTLGQGLAGIVIQLGAASRVKEKTPNDVQGYIDTALELARENLAVARRSAQGFGFTDTAPLGLVDAITKCISTAQRLTTADFKLKLQSLATSLSLKEEHELVRVAQEAIHNAVKHSFAKTISVELVEMRSGGIRLSVEDDGRGFDSTQQRSGMGLDSIRQRASALGADLTIATEPGLGTSLIVVLPTNSNGNAAL